MHLPLSSHINYKTQVHQTPTITNFTYTIPAPQLPVAQGEAVISGQVGDSLKNK